ncbi:ABC transporter ATP-binding protein [Paenibacillus sedimenti]|uniref:ABC transporter ATP-binding protein n=1 Tax=Paenibacillus sedimenti TaxID=2770274 RepID=A0A926QLS9_9BACL|nr:dipeptide/oligopeptide/nickel ABC transporter ATP-binding protein [Paenibacillus sedimenti]MBD0384236.1 ABC transporter ATP-binding protein [Paenibacillus sedimenti]
MSLLQLRNISKSYPKQTGLWKKNEALQVLEDISFELEEGECLGIVGESGSGKSTLCKLILGLEKPSGGMIRFHGADWHQTSPKQQHTLRRNLQAVFQDSYHALNPRMKAGQIISEPIRNYERLSAREMKIRQVELLEAVGLGEEDLNKFPHQFSGGQQQRLNIARALALRPKLIVFDEAVSSLDVLIQAQILELLQDLADNYGLAYIFVTHDIKAACFISDRLIVMDQGRIVERLDNMAHIEELRHPASRRLLDSRLAEHPGDRMQG